jgi:hypothetical protein
VEPQSQIEDSKFKMPEKLAKKTNIYDLALQSWSLTLRFFVPDIRAAELKTNCALPGQSESSHAFFW